MKKNNLPIARYAAMTSLEEVQLEKMKLLSRLNKQEDKLKEQVDEYLDVFRWIGNFSAVAKQIISTIPYFKGFKLFYKIIKLFWRK